MAGHKGKKVKPKWFSDRAYDLDRRQKARQGQFRETCMVCGFKVRGPEHEQGTHHSKRHPSMRSK